MSSHGDGLGETCKFGHYIKTYHGNLDHKIQKGIESGDIDGLDHEKINSLDDIIDAPYKQLKVSSNSQGLPRAAALDAADKFDDDLDYNVHKTEERIFVSPQSNLHGEYMQRRQQAEQNIKNTMQNLSQLRKQRHMLEHDIRKLRTRAEDMRTGNEVQVKGDFIELVDGAGAAGGQGGDEASLKFYRDNNIYPSIVADFNEMRGLDDLKDPEDSEYNNPRLNDVPNNEKAILRKKYSMYEKWKDMYGSEIQRKLQDLKSELKRIERSIDETEEWLEPYARDMVMINEGSIKEYKEDMTKYFQFKGTSTLSRHMEFICYRPLKNDGENILVVDEEDDATHYRVMVLKIFHLNFAGFEQPQTPQNGPSVAAIRWHPMIVCKHVFENFFQKKIDEKGDKLDQILDDYQGTLDDSQGKEIRKARTDKGYQIREVREKVGGKVEGGVSIEFSATLRRVEDGIDQPEKISEKYGEEVLKAFEEVIDKDLTEESVEDSKMYNGFKKKIRKFTGQVDKSVIPKKANPMGDLKSEFKYDYYYDYKLGLNLYTMK